VVGGSPHAAKNVPLPPQEGFQNTIAEIPLRIPLTSAQAHTPACVIVNPRRKEDRGGHYSEELSKTLNRMAVDENSSV
jgi:hypothetical protein